MPQKSLFRVLSGNYNLANTILGAEQGEKAGVLPQPSECIGQQFPCFWYSIPHSQIFLRLFNPEVLCFTFPKHKSLLFCQGEEGQSFGSIECGRGSGCLTYPNNFQAILLVFTSPSLFTMHVQGNLVQLLPEPFGISVIEFRLFLAFPLEFLRFSFLRSSESVIIIHLLFSIQNFIGGVSFLFFFFFALVHLHLKKKKSCVFLFQRDFRR